MEDSKAPCFFHVNRQWIADLAVSTTRNTSPLAIAQASDVCTVNERPRTPCRPNVYARGKADLRGSPEIN